MDPKELNWPKVDRYHCSLCTGLWVRSQLRVVDDERGFVAYRVCKNERLCAEYMRTVDWKAVQAECEATGKAVPHPCT